MSGIPLDTDILTRNGWKNFYDYIKGDLTLGQEIFTYDISTGETEWIPLSAVIYHGSVPVLTITSDYGYVLTAGELHPWVMEYTHNKGGRLRQIRLETTNKLKQFDKTRYDPSRVAKHGTIDTRYTLLIGERNAGVMGGGLYNISVLSGDLFIVNNEPDPLLTWSPINSNNTLLIRQNQQIVITGTYSKIPPGGINPPNNFEPLVAPIDLGIVGQGENININNLIGYSPLLGEEIVGYRIVTLPPPEQGELTLRGVPIVAGDLIPIDQINDLILITDPDYNGQVLIEYLAVDSTGLESLNPNTISTYVVQNNTNDLFNIIINRIEDIITSIGDINTPDTLLYLINLNNDLLLITQEIIDLIGDIGTPNTLLNLLSINNLTLQEIRDYIGDINTPNTVLYLLNQTNTPATPTIINVTGPGNTTAGSKFLEFSVELGPISIMGTTFNTADKKTFPYREGGYNSVPYDATGGSLFITEIN